MFFVCATTCKEKFALRSWRRFVRLACTPGVSRYIDRDIAGSGRHLSTLLICDGALNLHSLVTGQRRDTTGFSEKRCLGLTRYGPSGGSELHAFTTSGQRAPETRRQRCVAIKTIPRIFPLLRYDKNPSMFIFGTLRSRAAQQASPIKEKEAKLVVDHHLRGPSMKSVPAGHQAKSIQPGGASRGLLTWLNLPSPPGMRFQISSYTSV